jgi:hypothetical protein
MSTYNNALEKWVLSEMAEHLRYWEGEDREISGGDDLAFELFANENATGSYECSAYRATQWVKEYFEELGEVVDEMKNEWGSVANPFDEPERFQVQVVLFLASNLVWESITLRGADEAGTEVTMTDDLVERIAHDWEVAATY